MQPELDVINKKYAKDPNLLKQKQNEVYKKYNSKSMGGCFLMMLFMALNLTIFFTLFGQFTQLLVMCPEGVHEEREHPSLEVTVDVFIP